MWGFLTCLNDILVPHLKSIFDFSFAKVMLVQFSFFSAYFLFSVPWSKIVNTIGYQKSMVVGLLTMAIGAFLFVPAASTVSYPLFLAALLVLATGITGLQVSANPYVDLLGKPETASSRLDLTQAFNSLGTTIAPKIGGLLILSAAPLAVEQLRAAHAAGAACLPRSAGGFRQVALHRDQRRTGVAGDRDWHLRLPKIETVATQPGQKANDTIWKHRNLIYGLRRDFCLRRRRSVDRKLPRKLFRFTRDCRPLRQNRLGICFILLGRLDGRAVSWRATSAAGQGRKSSRPVRTLRVPRRTSMVFGRSIAMWTILAVGLFNSIMFPTIFSLGVAELGALRGTGSGVLNMAIVGGAILPVIQGVIADHVGLHHAFVLPVICYLYILFYALSGSRPNSERRAIA